LAACLIVVTIAALDAFTFEDYLLFCFVYPNFGVVSGLQRAENMCDFWALDKKVAGYKTRPESRQRG